MASFHVAALLGFRLTGLIWIAPVFSGRPVPARLKAAFLVLFLLLLLPVAQASVQGAPMLTPATIMGELVIGLTLGLGAAILVAAAEAAGDILAIQTGLSGASVIDPMSGTQVPTLGQFMGLVALMVFLTMDGQAVMLGALADSLAMVPAGAALGSGAGIEQVARIGAVLLELGVRIASPIMGSLVMSNVALGVVARTVPQLNVLMLAFPVQIALGLTALGVSLPIMVGTLEQWPDVYDSLITWILGAPGSSIPGVP
jgi:flagellar biosynthesis protein FliR